MKEDKKSLAAAAVKREAKEMKKAKSAALPALNPIPLSTASIDQSVVPPPLSPFHHTSGDVVNSRESKQNPSVNRTRSFMGKLSKKKDEPSANHGRKKCVDLHHQEENAGNHENVNSSTVTVQGATQRGFGSVIGADFGAPVPNITVSGCHTSSTIAPKEEANETRQHGLHGEMDSLVLLQSQFGCVSNGDNGGIHLDNMDRDSCVLGLQQKVKCLEDELKKKEENEKAREDSLKEVQQRCEELENKYQRDVGMSRDEARWREEKRHFEELEERRNKEKETLEEKVRHFESRCIENEERLTKLLEENNKYKLKIKVLFVSCGVVLHALLVAHTSLIS